MSVYVDSLFMAVASERQAHRVGSRNGHRWCHMIADSDEELHAMAARIGLRREWAQFNRYGWHYDLTPKRRAAAVAAGAVEMDRRGFVEVMRRNRERRSA